MAILSNGTINITIPETDEVIQPSIEKINKKASGGDLKQQVGGERLKIKCKARVPAALFRSIVDMLKDGSEEYFYTTEVTHPFYANVVQPIPVQVSDVGQQWDNRKFHYIDFMIESISYI